MKQFHVCSVVAVAAYTLALTSIAGNAQPQRNQYPWWAVVVDVDSTTYIAYDQDNEAQAKAIALKLCRQKTTKYCAFVDSGRTPFLVIANEARNGRFIQGSFGLGGDKTFKEAGARALKNCLPMPGNRCELFKMYDSEKRVKATFFDSRMRVGDTINIEQY